MEAIKRHWFKPGLIRPADHGGIHAPAVPDRRNSVESVTRVRQADRAPKKGTKSRDRDLSLPKQVLRRSNPFGVRT
jgi:hypothetical protein